MQVYLALGDSMCIDEYTGVDGGGAVSQFHRNIGPTWSLLDKTFDGCRIPEVPETLSGDLITLTVGGNDALQRIEGIITTGVEKILRSHLNLLRKLRDQNPYSFIIIGNIYSPQFRLPPALEKLLVELNAGIGRNVEAICGSLADISAAFKGKEALLLCQDIEPNLSGATKIAELFLKCYDAHMRASTH